MSDLKKMFEDTFGDEPTNKPRWISMKKGDSFTGKFLIEKGPMEKTMPSGDIKKYVELWFEDGDSERYIEATKTLVKAFIEADVKPGDVVTVSAADENEYTKYTVEKREAKRKDDTEDVSEIPF